MATAREWAHAYARQAVADYRAWQAMQDAKDFHECHRLLLFQMACEKLCKAHLILSGTHPDAIQTSHGFVANPLPLIIKQQLVALNVPSTKTKGIIVFARYLATEIEVLNPAMDRNGKRPDNCEYPWEDAIQVLHSPLDWTFHAAQLLLEKPRGRTFLKVLDTAFARILEDSRPD